MFSPARRMMFFRRSTKCRAPSSPRRAASPVEPAVAPGLGGGFLVLQVAREEAATGIVAFLPDQHLACFFVN
jgi:hypothetical protein